MMPTELPKPEKIFTNVVTLVVFACLERIEGAQRLSLLFFFFRVSLTTFWVSPCRFALVSLVRTTLPGGVRRPLM